MNRRGAYGSFRGKVAGMVDQMLGLKTEVNQSTGQMVFFAFLRSLVMITVVIGLAFFFAQSAQLNYYSDPKDDQRTYETIVWEDENLEKLDEAYQNDDFKTIRSLYAENSNVVKRWAHYGDYVLKEKCQTILEYEHISAYNLQNVLYFLYFPEYYTYRDGMKNADMEQYEAMRQSVIKMMEEKGYSEQELSDIYRKHADGYGYLSIGDLEQYEKE